MLKKLVQRLKSQTLGLDYTPITSPLKEAKERSKNEFIRKLSQHVLRLYERQADINKFTKLAISDPENNSHEELVAKLFDNGVNDFADEDVIYNLIDNDRFKKDLGL